MELNSYDYHSFQPKMTLAHNYAIVQCMYRANCGSPSANTSEWVHSNIFVDIA